MSLDLEPIEARARYAGPTTGDMAEWIGHAQVDRLLLIAEVKLLRAAVRTATVLIDAFGDLADGLDSDG